MDSQIQLVTERLQVRQIQMTDAETIFKYRRDPLVNQYQGWIPETINDVHEFIARKVSDEINVPGTWFQLVVIKKDENKLIGDVGVHFLADEPFQIEIGCTLNSQFQGQGFATEALKKIIDYLFNVLIKRRITAFIDPRNLSSIQLFERLGFRKEAHFKESLFLHGEWVDDLMYAIVKKEWQRAVSSLDRDRVDGN
ncbi:MAG: GNAT family N-acetyltransferase [Verrucomicrobia bacterium]|nr:GNAT family N-acetyltransferase [Prolixibacteraceae bacterium]